MGILWGVSRPKGSAAPSWEYHVERIPVGTPAEEEMLRDAGWFNAMGAEGWELASIASAMAGPPEGLTFYIFKRLKLDKYGHRYRLLAEEYAAWKKSNGLNLGSADGHHFDEDLTDEQSAWLYDFCNRWDEVLSDRVGEEAKQAREETD